MNKLVLTGGFARKRYMVSLLLTGFVLASLTTLFVPLAVLAETFSADPVVKLYCREAPTSGDRKPFDNCAKDVRDAHSTCDAESNGNTNTGANQTTTPTNASDNAAEPTSGGMTDEKAQSMATCIKKQLALSKNILERNIDPSKLAAAIKEGATNSEKEQCEKSGGTWKEGSTSGSESGDTASGESTSGNTSGDTSSAEGSCTPVSKNENKCNIEGVGWYLCPLMNFIAEMYDNMFDQLANRFLVIQDRMFVGDDNPTKATWELFRGIANLLFIAAFLMIVYSQATGVGLSSYGVKKLLPRLILAAIFVNMSYWICALAIDLSNLIGYGIRDLFGYVGHQVQGTGGSGQTTTETKGAATYIAVALAVTGGIVLLTLAIGVVIFGLLAFFMTLLILILRQALIVILVVVSPLAFVAYLLPNTQRFFQRWLKMFFSLLIIFPIIGAIFGGSSLVTTILNETDASADQRAEQDAQQGQNTDKGASSEMEIIILGVQALPLFAIPAVFINSLNAFGAMGGRIGAVVNGMNSMAKKSGKRRASQLWNRSTLGQAYKTGVAARDARAVTRFGRRAKRGNILAKSGAVAGGGKAGLDELGRRGNVLSEKAFNEDKDSYMMSWGEADYGMISDIATGKRGAANDAERTAAIEYIMQKGSLKEKMAAVGTSASVVANGDSHALAAITDGMAKNGLQEILGSKTFMLVRAGKVDGVTRNENTGADKVTIDERIGENAAEGAINPGALTKSSSASSFINDVANRGAIDAKGLDNLSKSITAARQDKTKNIGEDMKGHFSNIQQLSMKANSIPSGSTPAAATPRHTPGGKPADNTPLTPSAAKNPIPTSKPVNITPPAGGGVGVSAPSTGGAVFGSGVNTPPPPATGKPVNIPPTYRRK